MNLPRKRYLGDGAFVECGSWPFEFVLTTEDGIAVQNRIVLDGDMMAALQRFVEDVQTAVKKDHEAKGDAE